MTDAEMRARLLLANFTHATDKYTEPDIACKHCGRVIYCGDLSKICGVDCHKLKEQKCQKQ